MASIFSVTLTGDQEVAAVPVVTDASGTGTVVWDAVAGTATYSITVRNLDFGTALGMAPQTADPLDDVTSMHVHAQARGVNGPVVFGQINPAQDSDDRSITLNADGSWTIRGVWEATDPANQPIGNFAAALTAAIVGADVGLYFNVHSQQFAPGEIRGQWVAAGNTQDGTSGADTLSAPAGEALLALGGGGNDSITGGTLADVLRGGRDDDILLGGDGDDTIGGGAGNDSINTGLGNDFIRAGDGNDSVGGMAGRDTVHGGGGNDFIAWNDPTGDLVFGGAGDDTIIGGNIAADTISGGAGNDSIRAFATTPGDATAADILSGGANNDTIAGGNAADTIEGGTGEDNLTGNGGNDVFVFRDGQATGADVITDFTTGDVVRLEGFGSFDPLAALSASGGDTFLALGGGDSVFFQGRAIGDFTAADFVIA
ncbi:MAG: CHRD domain-containing protein [Acetobacteraceae bacterium]|nr:CHRD domain-containing protein [Acetobacteraceae bacterium]